MALEDFDTQETNESLIAQASNKPVQPAQPQAKAPVAKPAVAAVAAPAPKSLHADDEDLFDFPVVEMKLESEPAAKPAAPPKPVVPVAVKPVVPVAPVAPAPVVQPAPAREIVQAAQIVEDLEEVLGPVDEPRPRAKRLELPSPLALAGIGALVLTNVLGLFILWSTTRSYRSDVQAMNEKLAETLRRQAAAPIEPGPAAAQPANPEIARTPAGLEAFELSTLRVAREEIQAGEYAAARKRLARLLAVADRVEAEVREDVEAQAAFLIASTYRKQAETAREKSP